VAGYRSSSFPPLTLHAPWNFEKVCRHSSELLHAHAHPLGPRKNRIKCNTSVATAMLLDPLSRVNLPQYSGIANCCRANPGRANPTGAVPASAVSQKPWTEYGGCAVASQEFDNNSLTDNRADPRLQYRHFPASPTWNRYILFQPCNPVAANVRFL
jgi:hypothetical protein